MKKNILCSLIAVCIVGGSSLYVLSKLNYGKEVKNTVVAAEAKNSVEEKAEKNFKEMGDEEIIDLGYKYMKDYLNKDKDYYETSHIRRDEVLTFVTFKPKVKNNRFTVNSVTFDSETGEVLEVMAHNMLENFDGEADMEKCKETIINFFVKIGKEIDKDSILGKYDVDKDFGRVIMHFNLQDGKHVSAVIDLKDYSVISYSADYILYESDKMKTLED